MNQARRLVVATATIGLGSGLALSGCRTTTQSTVKDDSDTPSTAAAAPAFPFPYELGEAEYVDAANGTNEAYWNTQMLGQFQGIIDGGKANGGTAHRGAHAKQHGCALGSFTLDSSRPDQTKVGLFAADGTYPVWIRFSSSHPTPQADTIPDARGMAMKIIAPGVQGSKILPGHETSNAFDFNFVSAPMFPVGNVEAYSALVANTSGYIASHARTALLVAETAKASMMKSPLLGTYWSMGAYKLGSQAVKFKTWPCNASLFNVPLTLDSNYLRKAMAKQLASGSACFKFGVQMQANPNTMPVEDPSVEWRESSTLFSSAERLFGGDDPASPFVVLGEIDIPSQAFDNPQTEDFCERLSFNPWRTLPEQRPLGNLMRSRYTIYAASVARRNQDNGVQPVSDDVAGSFDDVTAAAGN